MKAVEFVNRFGWDLAKRDIEALTGGFINRDDFIEHYGFDILDDLKNLVEAKDLVDSCGGLSDARYMLDDPMIDASEAWDLSKAIKLVESVGNDQTRD